MTLHQHLEDILNAERALRDAENCFFESGNDEKRAQCLVGAVSEAKTLAQGSERHLRLERLSDLCAQVPGPDMADALIAILDEEADSVRAQAGEALVDVAFDRYADVARAIERYLDAGKQGPALSELPWVIAEVAEPSALPLLRRFLKSDDAEVAAAAIEACVKLGEPDAADAIGALIGDKRITDLSGDGELRVPLGELAAEAVEALRVT